MPFSIGNVKDIIRMMEQNHDWEKKKKKQPLTIQKTRNQTHSFPQSQSSLAKKSPSYSLAAMRGKLDRGERLTGEELEFLAKEDPDLHGRARQIDSGRKAYQRQLLDCTTKEEVRLLRMGIICSLVDEIKKSFGRGDGGAYTSLIQRSSALSDVHNRFMRSGRYHALPRDYHQQTGGRGTTADFLRGDSKSVPVSDMGVHYKAAANTKGIAGAYRKPMSPPEPNDPRWRQIHLGQLTTDRKKRYRIVSR